MGRTTIMGIVGGTASALGGGKFSNGAMSGAFTHMFNGEGGNILKKNLNWDKTRTNSSYERATSNLRKQYPNALIIAAHGDKDALYYTNGDGTQVSLYGNRATQLIQASGWTRGQNIILYSCNAGAGDNSPAEFISQTLNVNTIASTGYIMHTNIGLSYNFGDWKTFKGGE